MSKLDRPTAPEDLIAQLAEFPRIQEKVLSMWGTIHLKLFFEDLMADTRGGTRKGFPLKVSLAIFSLSLKNIEILESYGVEMPDPSTSFGDLSKTSWDIPKNF